MAKNVFEIMAQNVDKLIEQRIHNAPYNKTENYII